MLLLAVLTYTVFTSPEGKFSDVSVFYVNLPFLAYDNTLAVATSVCFTAANPFLVYLCGFNLSVLSISL